MPDARRGRHSPARGPSGDVVGLVVRLVLAGLLVAPAYDKVFDAEKIAAYSEGLGTGALPPLTVAAMLVYTQVVAGTGLALGLLTRPMALLAAIYAVAALILIRSGGLLVIWIVPLATLAGAVFLMLRGGGSLSLDAWRRDAP